MNRPAANNNGSLNNNDNYMDDRDRMDGGVRQPLEYQEDQLVGGPDERVGLLGITSQ